MMPQSILQKVLLFFSLVGAIGMALSTTASAYYYGPHPYYYGPHPYYYHPHPYYYEQPYYYRPYVPPPAVYYNQNCVMRTYWVKGPNGSYKVKRKVCY